MNNNNIARLSPSAARLFIVSLMMAGQQQTFDEMVERSGIRSWKSFVQAKSQLLELGFWGYDGATLIIVFQQEEKENPSHDHQ